jgi:hypothetical protein
VATPDKDVVMLLYQLGLQLATGSKRGQNVVEKMAKFFAQPVVYEQNVSIRRPDSPIPGFHEIFSNDRHLLTAANLFGLKGVNLLMTR